MVAQTSTINPLQSTQSPYNNDLPLNIGGIFLAELLSNAYQDHYQNLVNKGTFLYSILRCYFINLP